MPLTDGLNEKLLGRSSRKPIFCWLVNDVKSRIAGHKDVYAQIGSSFVGMQPRGFDIALFLFN
jgi:hypothetical protein